LKKNESPEKKRKAKTKILLWFAAAATAFVVFLLFAFLLLFHRPSQYNPSKTIASNNKNHQVSRYLTHELLPSLYNGIQLGEPFELIVTAEGINDIIGSSKWPKKTGSISFNAPVIVFGPGRVVMMGTMSAGAAQLVVTAEIEPVIDSNGLMNLPLTKVLVGAVNITAFAKALLSSLYTNYLESKGRQADELEARIIFSLLDDKAFEPAFELEGRKVRIENITVEQNRLVLQLVPADGTDAVVK